MELLEIGLTVATLPVMVLAVGLGVDYAFYIYNRIQYHLSTGLDVTSSFKQTLNETGMAVVFTALTLAVGVSTWAFSALNSSRYGTAFDLHVHDQYGHGSHCLAGFGRGDGAHHAAA